MLKVYAETELVKSLKEELKEYRRNTESVSKDMNQMKSGKPSKKTNRSSQYEQFLLKLDTFERSVDKFNSTDLVYYFCEKAKEAGYHVFISIARDSHVMKRLKDSYTCAEICAMIEFLFFSEQDYLDKERLSITVLGSRWVQTIYPDTKLWVEDKYIPRSKKSSKKTSYVSDREWKEPIKKNSSKIGDWED